jgi:hypothetical protein
MNSVRASSKVSIVLGIVLGLGFHAAGCSSDARATDACTRLEGQRCEKAATCPGEFPDFAERYGSVASCQRFYEVQCGRGVQESVKEPSRNELQTCLDAIKASCEAAKAPETQPACAFLVANTPAPDAGAAEAAVDAPATGADAPADGG